MSLVRVQHQEPRSLAAVSWGHSQAKAGLCKGSALILLVSQVRVVGKGTRNRKAGLTLCLQPCCRGLELWNMSGSMG